MSNLKYSFTKQETSDGNFVFRCEVDSFGLKNTTDKDIVSFYKKLSNLSYFDSGLLPVSGTGLLSLRYAANHTQIVYQHAPSINHINWGKYEGDSSAVAYYVAQPYRIVIADLIDNNFYGARTFYSPYPITHPDAELYHVNLPNINCRGYRGNGVGWICLYHTTDITSFPFSEKLAHVLERCSGIEAYNDANMSETDGPRFYSSYYEQHEDYEHLWNPQKWEDHSQLHGYEWTLDPNLWIPIKVTDIDDQGYHDFDGIPFTISMAMLGNYQAYYTDNLIPKPVNAIARFPEKFTNEKVENLFKVAFNASSSTNTATNVYHESTNIKVNLVNNPLIGNTSEDSEDDSDFFSCVGCDSSYDPDDVEQYIHPQTGDTYCDSCFHGNFVYVESEDQYYETNDDNLIYDNYHEEFFLLNGSYPHKQCSCGEIIFAQPGSYYADNLLYLPIYSSADGNTTCCYSCLPSSDNFKCCLCNSPIPDQDYYDVHQIVDPRSKSGKSYACNACANRTNQYHSKLIADYFIDSTGILEQETYCICGEFYPISQMMLNRHYILSDQEATLCNIFVAFSSDKMPNDFIQQNKDLLIIQSEHVNMPHLPLKGSITHVCPECYAQIAIVVLEGLSKYSTYLVEAFKNFFDSNLDDDYSDILNKLRHSFSINIFK
jgi:hypothetical protein